MGIISFFFSRELHEYNRFVKSLTIIFLVFVPKREGLMVVIVSKPISELGGFIFFYFLLGKEKKEKKKKSNHVHKQCTKQPKRKGWANKDLTSPHLEANCSKKSTKEQISSPQYNIFYLHKYRQKNSSVSILLNSHLWMLYDFSSSTLSKIYTMGQCFKSSSSSCLQRNLSN